MPLLFEIIEYGSPIWKKAVQLREKVLRRPFGSVFSEKELAQEKEHFHIAGFINDQMIATAVLVLEPGKMKMQRVVVVEHLRGTNIGSNMMRFCENFAKDMKVKIIYCHARDSAVGFYSKNNYQKVGDYFEEDGILHLMMKKEL